MLAHDRQRMRVIDVQEQAVPVLQFQQAVQRRRATHRVRAVPDVGNARVPPADVLQIIQVVVVAGEDRAFLGADRFDIGHAEMTEPVEDHHPGAPGARWPEATSGRMPAVSALQDVPAARARRTGQPAPPPVGRAGCAGYAWWR